MSISIDYETKKKLATEKATLLMDKYIDNAVSGTQRIISAKENENKTYIRAVQSELPGAPRNARQGTLHCLYGQYTQLNRAIKSLGDTIHIIPVTDDNAHMSSSAFKKHMTKLYDNQEYPNAIYSGQLYTSSKEYTKALNRYFKRNHATSDELQEKYTQEFNKKNYCVKSLNPGTIIIVNSGHAIMYLGQGRIKNGYFVPDEKNGRAICCTYNAEHAAIPLTTWNTHNSFAADIQNIATKKYEQEIDSMISNKQNILSIKQALGITQHFMHRQNICKTTNNYDVVTKPKQKTKANNNNEYRCYALYTEDLLVRQH